MRVSSSSPLITIITTISRATFAIVRPSAKSTEAIAEEGPDIVQAGEHNYNVVSTKKGFAGHPAAWRDNEIEYYAHGLD